MNWQVCEMFGITTRVWKSHSKPTCNKKRDPAGNEVFYLTVEQKQCWLVVQTKLINCLETA